MRSEQARRRSTERKPKELDEVNSSILWMVCM